MCVCRELGGYKALAVEIQFEAPRRVNTPVTSSRRAGLGASTDSETALDNAVNGLSRSAPHFSARVPFWARQIIAMGFLVGLVAAAFVVATSAAFTTLFVALAIPFSCIAIFRTAAILFVLVRRSPDGAMLPPSSDDALPTYSILVPLYGEANMAPQIVAALTVLDYPVARLEVLIILEADDHATRAAFDSQSLPTHFNIITVPHVRPKTKPKALNFALKYACGDYVVVYDAEDLPAPGQLRTAARMFANTPDTVACLQGRLLIHNATDSWLTRQFSLEYLALFDGLLPAYQALGLPLPLGGTSNHFPRHILKRIGGWDPHNVTEDADLGIRLVRLGYEARMLPSETWEEAPERFAGWLPQRTRWLKGWMQTWLVHTRQPLRALTDMGLVAFVGFHMIFGGMVLAALVHPFMYVLLVWQYFTIGPFASPIDGAGHLITALTAFNLALGYTSAMVLCAISALRRRQSGLLLHILTLPVYWLLVSAAAWRALWQLLFAPFKWEKTQHRIRV